MVNIIRGMRVRAEWWEAAPLGAISLAGVQAKTQVHPMSAEGVVTHIRGDNPVTPTSAKVWIMTESGQEVSVDVRHIVAVDDGA